MLTVGSLCYDICVHGNQLRLAGKFILLKWIICVGKFDRWLWLRVMFLGLFLLRQKKQLV